jgi:hypothetical protein
MMKWHEHAGGTCARDDKHGFTAHEKVGSYHISPVSHKYDSQNHLGYSVTFANDQGFVGGVGLWTWLSVRPVSLRDARRLCEEHLGTVSNNPGSYWKERHAATTV